MVNQKSSLIHEKKKKILSSNPTLLFDYPSVGVQCSHLIQLLLMLSLGIKRSYGNVWHQGVTSKQFEISPRVAI